MTHERCRRRQDKVRRYLQITSRKELRIELLWAETKEKMIGSPTNEDTWLIASVFAGEGD